MATSSALSTSNQFVKYTISITQNSQSITNNTSNVTVSVRFYRTNTGYTTYGTGTLYVKINGTTYTQSVTPYDEITNSGITLFTKTLDIAHGDDGAKTLTCSAWISHNAPLTSTEQSYSQVLTTIPRKSTMSVSNGTLGTAQTLTVTRKSTSFTHTITYTCGSYSGTICTKSSNTSISWTPPLDLATGAPNGTSVYVSFTITTYNGNTAIGSNTSSITCVIPTSVVPTVSIAVSDPNGYLSTYGGYIQGKSKFKIDVTASGKYYSTIASYKTTVDGKTFTSSSFTTDVIQGSGTLSISCTVTDSRGRTATVTKSITVIAYSAPKITALTVYRSNSDGAANSTGSYLSVKFSASITSLNSKNSATYVVSYKKTTASSYTNKTITAQSGKYSVSNAVYTFSADTAASYNILVKATDAFTSSSLAGVGASIFKLFSLYKTGKGLGIGKISELDNTVDIDLDLKTNTDVYGTVIGVGYAPEIPANSNFNDYVIPGMYSVRSYNNANTISNMPHQTAGRLKVEMAIGTSLKTVLTHEWAYVLQTFYTIDGYKYTRLIEATGTAGVWSYRPWTKYLTDADDYIISQGTSGIWTYRKWNSGVAECWGRTTARTVSISTVWGQDDMGIYVCDDAVASCALPFTFAAIPKTLASPVKSTGNYWLYTCYEGDTTVTPSYGVARGNKNTSITVLADLYVIGRWK